MSRSLRVVTNKGDVFEYESVCDFNIYDDKIQFVYINANNLETRNPGMEKNG